MAEYENEPGVYIFYCDVEWNVLTDMLHADLADAEKQARLEYRGLKLVDAAAA